jgi:hypothetical protein
MTSDQEDQSFDIFDRSDSPFTSHEPPRSYEISDPKSKRKREDGETFSALENSFDDVSDAFQVGNAHRRLAGKLDQVGPDLLRVRKQPAKPLPVTRKKMDRHVASLNFISGAVENLDDMRS